MNDDLSDFSMMDLFRAEVESQSVVLTESLLALERNPTDSEHHECAMRAAQSLKGEYADRKIIDLTFGDLLEPNGQGVTNRRDRDLTLAWLD